MAASYIPEDHSELTGVGRRTHTEIDEVLDSISGIGSWKEVALALTPSLITNNEVTPQIVRIPLPSGLDLTGAKALIGSMDGRHAPSGSCWQPASNGLAIEVFVPSGARRAHYIAGQPVYYVQWFS